MSVHVLNPVHSPRVLDLVRVLLRVWRCGSVFACRPPFPTHTAFCFCSPVPVLHRFGVSDHVHFLVRHTHVGVVCVQSLDSVSACSASCKRSSAACVRTYPLFVLLGAAGLSTGIESGVSRAATGWHYCAAWHLCECRRDYLSPPNVLLAPAHPPSCCGVAYVYILVLVGMDSRSGSRRRPRQQHDAATAPIPEMSLTLNQ